MGPTGNDVNQRVYENVASRIGDGKPEGRLQKWLCADRGGSIRPPQTSFFDSAYQIKI
jgi:hypothetical protein